MALIGVGVRAALNVLSSAAESHTRCEDDFRIEPALGVAVVASGNGAMGAQGRAGAVLTTWSVIGEAEAATPGMSGEQILAAGFRRAHEVVERVTWSWTAHRPVHSAAALHVDGDRAWLAHVGTARVSRIAAGRLTPLTVDHSLLNELSAEQRAQWSDRMAEVGRVVTRALGQGALRVDVREMRVHAGDWFLIASATVHHALTDDEISGVLGAPGRPPEAQARGLLAALAATVRHERSVAFTIVGVGEGPRAGHGGSSRPPAGWLFQPGRPLPEPPPEWRRETASQGPDPRWFEQLAGPIMAL